MNLSRKGSNKQFPVILYTLLASSVYLRITNYSGKIFDEMLEVPTKQLSLSHPDSIYYNEALIPKCLTQDRPFQILMPELVIDYGIAS